jgi:hypothetical protein
MSKMSEGLETDGASPTEASQDGLKPVSPKDLRVKVTQLGGPTV